jgi:RND superfamily putative drug exporter
MMQLARLVVRRRRLVALAWVGIAAAFLPRAGRVADTLEAGAHIRGSQSAAVDELLAGPLASSYAAYGVLVVGGAPSPATPTGAALLRRIVRPITHAPGVAGVFSYLDYSDTLFAGSRGTGTFVLVGFEADTISPDRRLPPLRALTRGLETGLRAEYPGLSLRWTGETALNVDLRRASSLDVRDAERRALPVTAAFLLFAFGALAAALIPVVAGAGAIAVTLGAAAVAARIWPLSIVLESVVAMLGLGLGIDYALLMVSRFREGLAAGAGADAAAEAAARYAGRTILLSGATVALGFAVLLTVPLNEMRAIAVGGLLVVVVSALIATTLLPGVLAILGARVDWGRVRRRASRQSSARRWRRWGHWVTGHPWSALAFGALPLLVLAAQAARLRIGFPRGDWLPPSMESARATEELRAMGRSGVVQSVRVVVQLPEGRSVRREADWDALSEYAGELEADPRIERVRSIFAVARAAGMTRRALVRLPEAFTRRLTRGLMSPDGRVVLLELVPHDSVTLDGAVELVRGIRTTGAARSGVAGARVLVGGLPGFNADYQDAVAGRFREIVALVLGGTLIALFVGFRSILVPLKAVVLNLLSVAAAFGVLTLVFQEGHGARLLGVAEPLGAVFSSLPVIVFCIVFGLSMDYEVFLMTRVMEARRSGLADRDAIVEALGTTAQVITSAAAIMLVVFAAFTAGDFLLTKMLGFALAAAVLVDATVVRMVIGPALLQLAGRWNWWPGRAARVGGP